MSAESQSRLIGEPTGESVTIEADARTLCPFFDAANVVVDECKLRVTEDGLGITAVDPANVGMVDVTLYADALDTFDPTGETAIGLPLHTLQSVLKSARKGRSNADALSLSFDSSTTRVEIDREYGDSEVTQRDEFLNIDTNAVRQEPDIPDLDGLDYKATFDAYGFRQTIDHIDALADYVLIEPNGDDLRLCSGQTGGDDPTEATVVTVHDAVGVRTDEDSGKAAYSLDYVTDYAKAAHSCMAETVTLNWGEEYLITIGFEYERDETVVFDAEYMLAPRRMGEGDRV